jgi:imidazolonepropionase-like amidohydrolase
MHRASTLITSTFALTLAAASLVILPPAQAQLAPVNGMRPADLRAHAIVDATVIPAPGEKIEHATIIVHNGVIEAVGPNDQVKVPAGARLWKGEGMTVYPGLIESALMVRAEYTPSAGSHWNTRIRPEVNMAEQPAPDQALRKELRGLGFTAAAVYPSAGAMRGSGTLLALADENEHVLAYRDRLAMAMSFDSGGGGGGGRRPGTPATPPPATPAPAPESSAYPGSLMGAHALLRQTFHDARWHAQCESVWEDHPDGHEPPLRADALAALEQVVNHKQQVLFDASDDLNGLRGAKVVNEFAPGMLILLGSGLEFRHLNEILSLKAPIIVPLEFPRRPDVSTMALADGVSLRDMMTWEQAPTNPRRLLRGNDQQPGATIALTTHRLRSRNEFHSNLRSAIKHGLTEDEALAALTTAPAKLMNVDNVMGTIAPGKLANLVVVKGSLFDKDGKVYDTWVNGRRYEVNSDAIVQLKGSGTIKIDGAGVAPEAGGTVVSPVRELSIDVDTVKFSVTIHLPDKKKVAAKKVIAQQDQLAFVTDGRPLDVEGYVQYSGVISGNSVTGTGAMPDGSKFQFIVNVTPKAEGAKDAEGDKEGDRDKSDQKKEGENVVASSEPAAESARDGAKEGDPITGTWTVQASEMPPDAAITMTLKLEEDNAVTGTVSVMGNTHDLREGRFDPATGKLTYTIVDPDNVPGTAEAMVTGDSMTGKYTSPAMATDFTGSRLRAIAEAKPGEKKQEEKFVMPPEQLNYPLGEYGRTAPPQPEDFIIINATIWTSGPQGIIKNGWMHIQGGKIAEIGAGSPPRVGGTLVDLQGKHITPGLIDCHSHTGINGGVNEFAQTNTAECRIADCIDPTDVDWYRQLAGGLTAANQLHGSANPIGGQNSVVKLKWGAAGGPEAFPIRGAIAGIKFALGENVKRSTNRYPNTRMGVETFIRDAFTAAKEYKAKWERYNALPTEQRSRTMPPQRDLELDTLVEILDKQRLIHCHSYRQDEILMLIRIADHFGFTIGTFQHVLEGFKVADAIGKHGAGASSFSDWWAYKVEVMDAIPYNGSLMNNVGVLVSFNSDSDELARRMNWEASKAVRYGGMEPNEALKFVTINPAKQLRIDNRTGSLEKGKDADFVIWSGDPLSVYTRCVQTWIEGAKYFDIEADQQMRADIQRERTRLIQKILAQAHGDPTKPGADDKKEGGSGEARPEGGEGGSPDGERRFRRRPPQEVMAWIEEQARLGRDPDEIRPGECGCGGHFEEQ